MNPFIHLAMGYIVSLLFFYKVGLRIKWPTMVDMPFCKETQPELNTNNLRTDVSVK